ncbi:MAG: DUF5652 family protein [Candidatus Paceibacterota bacterium]|jgi:hypothetical protein
MMNNWHGYPVGFAPGGAFLGIGILVVIVSIIVVVLKGYALWHAARRSEPWWFIILLIVNTLGILELIYLYFVVGKWHSFSESAKTTDSAASSGSNTPKV